MRCAASFLGRSMSVSAQRSGKSSRTIRKHEKLPDALRCSMSRRAAAPTTSWQRRILSSSRLLDAFAAISARQTVMLPHTSLKCFLVERSCPVSSAKNMCRSGWTTPAKWSVHSTSIWTMDTSMRSTSWTAGSDFASRMSAALSTSP